MYLTSTLPTRTKGYRNHKYSKLKPSMKVGGFYFQEDVGEQVGEQSPTAIEKNFNTF